MAKKLRMGHAKLLETLSALEDAGLIAIERGDREHSNVYTLLEVPKRGVSEQKQGVSEQKQGGVSEQKQYKRSVFQNSSKGIEQSKEKNPYDLDEYLKSKGL